MNKAMNYQKENGFFSVPMEENYHMNLDALKAFMPEKHKLLEELHEEIGGTFYKNSTPVYDITSGKIYFSLGLDRTPGDSSYNTIRLKVKRCLDMGITVPFGYGSSGKQLVWKNGGSFYEQRWDNVEGHTFIAIEDLPLKILKSAIKNQLKSLSEADEKEVNDINNFLNASKELDIALYEAKRLLKE